MERRTFLEWCYNKICCHICNDIVDEDFVCGICEEYYCEKHSAVYNQFTQIDYNCCKECANQM